MGKDVVLELLGPGEIFGGVAVIEGRPYPAAAQATEPSVVVKIPADIVVGLAERHPPVVREMALLIGRRLRAAHDSVTRSVEPVEARLAATLLRLAGREGVRTKDAVELPFHLTRQSLADMSGTTVETAIRVVSRWLRAEVVEDRGGRLADPAGPGRPARSHRGRGRIVALFTWVGGMLFIALVLVPTARALGDDRLRTRLTPRDFTGSSGSWSSP